MLGFLPPFVRGCIALLLLALNTLFWCLALFACALVKLALPFEAVRKRIDPVLNRIAGLWIACNSGWMRLTQRTDWDVEGLDDLRYRGWYLVNCNHQSWADIFVLQHLLNGRIPMLKFFLKQQLIYVPVIGLAWWALDFPFMKRHGKAELRKRPELRSQDEEATRRACEKFALVPTSVMNFAEGTRFTPAKHRAQGSPYRHLLKPKAGALALALNAMGERFHSLIDVTIVYPGGAPDFWQFLCGRAPRIVVRLRELPIPAEFCAGDYTADPAFRVTFQRWLAALWEQKDRQIEELLAPGAGAVPRPRAMATTAAAVVLALGLALAMQAPGPAHAQGPAPATAPATAAASAQAPAAARAIQPLNAGGLRAKHKALAPQLRNNQFQGALFLDSVETSRSSRGDVYAVVDHPFEKVSAALSNQDNWCDILILHLNVKYCRGAAQGSRNVLDVRLGRKFDEPLERATTLVFAWRVASATPEYLAVELDAPTGPFGTRDYGLLMEAVSLDSARTFIHMGYSFGYGTVAQLALSAYLGTIGSDKVGFSTVPAADGGQPRHVQGMRGLAERNVMRYYLAIDAFLDALAAPPADQFEKRIAAWFAATEKYPAQLHEVERGSYLEMKRNEVRRQQQPASSRAPG